MARTLPRALAVALLAASAGARARVGAVVDAALEPQQAAGAADTLESARQHLGAATDASRARKFEDARAHVAEALALLIARDEPDGEINALLRDLAKLAAEIGDLPAAERALRAALEGAVRALPEGNREPGILRLELSDVLFARGELREALQVGEDAVASFALILPEDDEMLLAARANLATTLQTLGELSRARALQEQVLAGFARILPEEDDYRLATEMNLGITLASLGDLARARELFEHALAVRIRIHPADHPNVQLARQNLSIVLSTLGDHESARELQEETVAACERTLPDDHVFLQTARQNLSTTLAALGEEEAALALIERVLEIRERTLSEEHPDLQNSRQTFGLLLRHEGDLTGALRWQEMAMEARARTLAEGSSDLIKSRQELALTLAFVETRNPTGDGERRKRYLRLVQELLGDLRAATTSALLDGSSREAEERLSASDESLGKALSLAQGCGVFAADRELEREVFLVSEMMRAAVLASARVASEARAAAGWASLQERRRVASEELARLAQLGAPAGELEGLREELEEAERALVRLAAREGGFAASRLAADSDAPGARLDALAARLDADAALVAYRRYTSHRVMPGDPPWITRKTSLCAFVLGRAENGARLERVELGAIAPIEAAVEAWRAAIGARRERGMAPEDGRADLAALGETLRALVLDPLRPALEGTRRLVVVPDDVLHLVPLDALPAGTPWATEGERDEPLGAFVAVELRSSALELLDDPAPVPVRGGLVALGGASFDLEPVDLEEEDSEPESAPSEPAATRSAAWERAFGALPETRAEIRAIAEYFAEAFEDELPAVLLEGRGASRESLFRLAPGARFLHVATHGWFAPESIRSLDDPEPLDPRSGTELRSSGAAHLRGMRPMLLCGLALAGANLPPDPAGRLTGLVTAEELATLDLSDCELAVLSACDTNVGARRAGQGVASLQRALHMAGARSVITSLWRVPDEATRELMVDFYRRVWLHGTPKARALWEAKTRLRLARDESGAPRYTTRDWAAWVLSGDPE